MKCTLLVLSLTCSLFLSAQDTYRKISENYFRSKPFNWKFSEFLNHLMNDPTLVDKNILKKTDSTLFFLEGTYSNHNPFFFKAERTRIILAEKQEIIDDSSKYFRTIYVYQLLGYAPKGEKGMEEVKEEFGKFCRRYKKGFDEGTYEELKKGTFQSGEIKNYRLRNLPFYPLTVAWGSSTDHTNNVFALTIRFIVFENTPFYPEGW